MTIARISISTFQKKTNPVIVLAFLLLVSVYESSAQSTSVDLEYRFNPTYSRGFRQPLYAGEKAGFFTQQRTRLILNYNNPDSLKAQVILQDRRAWGEITERADVAEVSIFRAWLEKSFRNDFSLKLGRQGLVYDDQHIFGELNWGGTLAHDLALGKYEKGTFKAHLGLAVNANRVNELKRDLFQPNIYKNMQFLYLSKKWDKQRSSLWLVNHGLEQADTTVAYTQTFGSNTSVPIGGKLKFTGVFFQQIGRDATDRKVNASFLSLQLLLKSSSKWSFSLGLDKMSGTDLQNLTDPGAKSSTYNILFGLRHGRFGYLDYFYLLIDPVFGLQDYYAKIDYTPSSRLRIRNNVHFFQTDANAYAAADIAYANPLDSFLGVENDLTLRYSVAKDFNVTLGHSIMFGSNTLDEMFGGVPSRENQFFYAVIVATPRIFQKKSE
ncbi:MAG: alginate export family protein [Cyclobacteriaceae bacterium]